MPFLRFGSRKKFDRLRDVLVNNLDRHRHVGLVCLADKKVGGEVVKASFKLKL